MIMEKTKIGPNVYISPMPMTIVGALVDGKPNFLPVAWINRVNANPPIIAVSIGKNHYTGGGIKQNQAFSVNVPGEDLLTATDYLGLISGRNKDKSAIFDLFYGEMAEAPFISKCCLNFSCRLIQTVDLPSSNLFLGEVKETFIDADCLSDGKPDIKKMKPFVLTMPDNNYWQVGDQIGRAWEDGRSYRP